MLTIKALVGLVGILAMASLGVSATAFTDPAENYPDRVIKLVVPYPAGGAGDVIGRLVAKSIEKSLGQTVVIENKPGAAGAVGAAFVARSKPDGYTILLATNGILAANPYIYASTPFDTLRDFEFISQVADAPIVLVTHPSVPANSIQEFVAFAKNEPGTVSYASGGIGTIGHLTAELFMADSGIKLFHVPYKGTAPAHIDLLAGRVMSMFDQIATSLQDIQAGNLRALVVTEAERHVLLPNVPTVIEIGYKNSVSTTWYGLVAPAKTPIEIIAKLSKTVTDALATPEARAAFGSLALDPATSTPEETRAFITSELAKWKAVVMKAGIKVN